MFGLLFTSDPNGESGRGEATREDRDATRWRHPELHHLQSTAACSIAQILTILTLSILRCFHTPHNMFRTAARSFAATALRSAESPSQVEALKQTAINISKAQGVGQRGFIDGTSFSPHCPPVSGYTN